MIKPSNTVPTEKIQVLTCCLTSGKAKVERALRPYHPRVTIREELNKGEDGKPQKGLGYTVTIMATKEAVEWVEYLLCNAGFPLLSQPYNPEHAKYQVACDLGSLKGAHERLHREMPVAWEDSKYKPPPKQHKHVAPKRNDKAQPGAVAKWLKDWL